MKSALLTIAASMISILSGYGQAPQVIPLRANIYFDDLPAETRAVIPAHSTGEIPALAAGLENDAALIVAYVRNHFRYTPYYGHLKGPHETLMDQAGNDYDLSRLTIELLRAAGHTANYVRGTLSRPAGDVNAWLGTSNLQAAAVLREAGIPYDAPGAFNIDRVWVRVNGVNVDPAFKPMRKINGVNVGTLMNYSQSQLMVGAGGTSGGNLWAKNISASGIESRLQTYTNNLLTSLKNNHPNATVADIIGGYEIIPLTVAKGDLAALAISGSGTNFNDPDPKRMHTVKVTLKDYQIDSYDEEVPVTIATRIINLPDIDGRIFCMGSIPGSAQPANIVPHKVDSFHDISAMAYRAKINGGYNFIPQIHTQQSNYASFTINKIRNNANTGGSDTIQLVDDPAGVFRLYVTESGIPLTANPGNGYTFLSYATSITNPGYAKDIHVLVRKDIAPGNYEARLKVYDYSIGRHPQENIEYDVRIIASILPNHVMQLKVGNTVVWDDSTVTAINRKKSYGIVGAINHPYPGNEGTYADQTMDEEKPRRLFRGGKYVVCTQVTDVRWMGRRISDRLDRCQALTNLGQDETSEEMTLNMLSAFGAQYLLEEELVANLAASLSDGIVVPHHNFALACLEAGYVMDHKLTSTSFVGRSGAISADPFWAAQSMFGSAFEHGSYEQFQNGQSVSTIKALYVANQQGQTIYKVDKTTLPTIRAELTNYDPLILNGYQVAAEEENCGYVMHQDGATEVDDWAGLGMIKISSSGGRAMLIGNGFNYYVPPSSGGVSATRTWESDSTRMVRLMREARRRLLNARMAAMSAEPVDLKTGAYVYNVTELTVGNAAPPRGLDFQRSYNSDASKLGGPLGRGWDHNWNSRADITSDPKMGMGMRLPADAAAWIVASHAMRQMSLANENGAKGMVVQAIIAKWAVDQVKDNSVSVKLASEAAVFTRQPNGSYTPPPGSKFTLEKSGNNHLLKNRTGTTFTFDANGKMATLADIYGKSLSVTWTGDLVSSVKDAYNRQLTFNYGSDTLLDSVTSSAGGSISFGYLNGNLTTFTDPDANIFRYAYDGENRLQEFRNGENEVVAFNHYDARNKVDYQDSEGLTTRRWRFFITPYRTVQQDPKGGQTIYEYDRWGRQTTQTDALGNRQTFEYNAHDQLKVAIDAKLQRTEFDYDNRLNLTKTRKFKGAVAVETGATYDSLNRQDSVTNANNKTVTFHYNALHEKDWEQTPDGHRTTYTYHPAGHSAAGQLHTVTVPGENSATHTTTYLYDSNGHPDLINYPDGTSEDFTYDARGNMTGFKDRKNQQWTYHYNGRRLLHREIDPNTKENVFTYNSYGKVLTATDRNGKQTVNTYHPSGWIRDTTNAESEKTVYQYDSRDWLTKVISPLGNEVETTYYANGWVDEVIDPRDQATKSYYQPNGNREKIRNALQQNTTFGFDDLNRVESVTNTRTVQTIHTLDAAGNTRFLKNGRNQETESVFDSLNRETDLYTPLRRHTHRVYSPRGLLTSVTEPSTQPTAIGYDEVGRVETRTDNVGSTVYGHDANGNVETVTEGGKTITRQYDNLNRLTLYRNGAGEEIEYRYYPAGNLWKIIYPDKTKVVEYFYDGANRLKKVKDWSGRETLYDWDDDGRLTKIERDNGTSRVIGYDASGNTTSIREIGSSGLLAYFKFERDALGRVKHEMRAPCPPPYQTAVQNSTYDADDRLATYNGLTVTNDADGNMTSAPVAGDVWKTFQYDARNRLTSVDGSAAWENIFDAEGIRVETRKEGVSTKFVISPGALPKTLVQINPDNTRRYFIYGLGLLYHIDDEETTPTTTTYHYNAQGSTVALSNDSGAPVGRFSYDPYGLVQHKEGNTNTIFQFNGHYGIATDPTGLVHLNARFYNPHLKRFMNSDPAGFAGGLNWFAYASGDPVNLFDPLGLGPADSERYTWVDGMQDGIGVAGFFPGLGVIPDGVNGVIYLFRGKWTDAGFSLAAMIPLAGDLVAAGKYADRLNDVRKIADSAVEADKQLTVIGHLPDVVSVAEKNGANYLKPTADWSWQKQGDFIRGVIERGDDVLIGTRIRPGESVLRKEIKQLVKAGYEPAEQGSNLLIKKR